MGAGDRRHWLVALDRVARAAVREPIVVVLLLAGVFTVISGSHVHGALLLAVAVGLAWDAARVGPGEPAAPQPDGTPGAGPAGQTGISRAWVRATARRRLLTVVALIASGALCVVVVGSFARYSWPATLAVAGLAALVLVIGWQEPRRPSRDPGKLPRRGVALWAGWLVTAGAWELAAYFQQPSLTAISYEHPTVSALVDPLLASHPGRTAALVVWLTVGWFLLGRR